MNAASAAMPIDIRAEGTAGRTGTNRAASAAPARAIVPESAVQGEVWQQPHDDDFQTTALKSRIGANADIRALVTAIRWSRVSPDTNSAASGRSPLPH